MWPLKCICILESLEDLLEIPKAAMTPRPIKSQSPGWAQAPVVSEAPQVMIPPCRQV